MITIVINLWVIITGYFMMTVHKVSYIDNIVITSYILLSLWMLYIIHHISSHGRKVIFGFDAVLQLFFPLGFTIFWFISNHNVQWIHSAIRVF